MFKKYYESGTLLGGILLVAGTTIGGGMLGNPVVTASAGLMPSLLLYTLCWAFMVSTALLLVEVYLWYPGESNYISMAGRTLGKVGKAFCWFFYLFFFSALVVAYLSGGGRIFADLLFFPPTWGPLLLTLVVAPIVYLGTASVERFNSWLMLGLFAAFLFFIASGFPKLNLELLERSDWGQSFKIAPILFASFGFHGVVPTLTASLDRDPKKVRLAILIGSTIPLIVYTIWQIVILGVVPLSGLLEAKALGESAVYPLKKITNVGWLAYLGDAFAFFAITTSLLGVALGLRDFLADGFGIPKRGGYLLLLILGIFLIPLGITMINPCLFLNALNYGGGVSSAILLGLFPILMALSGRYILKKRAERLLPGGLVTTSILLIFLIFQFLSLL
jgi:tyrosine-specific transport protein